MSLRIHCDACDQTTPATLNEFGEPMVLASPWITVEHGGDSCLHFCSFVCAGNYRPI